MLSHHRHSGGHKETLQEFTVLWDTLQNYTDEKASISSARLSCARPMTGWGPRRVLGGGAICLVLPLGSTLNSEASVSYGSPLPSRCHSFLCVPTGASHQAVESNHHPSHPRWPPWLRLSESRSSLAISIQVAFSEWLWVDSSGSWIIVNNLGTEKGLGTVANTVVHVKHKSWIKAKAMKEKRMDVRGE